MRATHEPSLRVVVIGFTLFAIGSAAAQTGTGPVTLGPARGAVVVGNEPAALELSNGLVASTMMGAYGVVLIDFDRARADTIGRRGGGPNEFAAPRTVFPWAQGKYAIVDVALARVAIFTEPSRFDSIIPIPPGHRASSAVARPTGAWFSAGAPDRNDSMPLVRSIGQSGPRDTIARLARPRSRLTPIGAGTAMNLQPEYAARDDWGVLPDGRIWIARGADNRVDWIAPGGRLQRGASVPFARIKTVDADRHKFHGMPAPVAVDTVDRAIAPVKAPFQEVVAGPDGELWFWLNQPAGYKTERYRRIDSHGAPLTDVELPLAHKILAVGRKTVYVLSTNQDDELVLSRHAKPR